MLDAVGLLAVASALPKRLLDNDHWRRHHPDLVAQAEQKIWMWKRPTDFSEGSTLFNLEMEPYLRDPFRGTRQRRVLAAGDRILDLEVAAAREALEVAGVDASEVDLLISSALLSDQPGIGSAAFLAQALGLQGAAFNLESACASTVIGIETAAGLVRAGQYRKVLVVTSCAYSRATREDDPIAWGVGDAATAVLVGHVEDGIGLLGTFSVNSAETNPAVSYQVELDDLGKPYLRMRTGRAAAQLLRDTSEQFLHECVAGALVQSGVELGEIDHFVFNTPLAWYARFCARSLQVDPARTLSVYPLYANVGPCLPGLTLHHAASWRGYRRGDLVLVYSVGSVSSCAAAVIRWGDVRLGRLPEGASQELLHRLESEASMASPSLQVA